MRIINNTEIIIEHGDKLSITRADGGEIDILVYKNGNE